MNDTTNPVEQRSAEDSENKQESGINITVVRDIVLILILDWAAIFGTIFVMIHLFPERSRGIPLLCCTSILITMGFTLSGYLARGNRWLHLACVAGGLWVLDWFGLFFISSADDVGYYVLTRGLLILVLMIAGGVLSSALKSPKSIHFFFAQIFERDQKMSRGFSVTVVRDIMIVLAFAFGGLFAIMPALNRVLPDDVLLRAIAGIGSVFFLLTMGFTISGCLARGNHWRHLFQVAVGVWLGDSLEIFFFRRPNAVVFLAESCLIVCLAMLCGGALSVLLKRKANA